MFGRLGAVIDVPEQLVAVAVGCSGIGPAYWACLIEAWASAAESFGLPKALASSIINQSMAGTAAMVTGADSAESLVSRVATPGGSTEKGLAVLVEAGLPVILAAALEQVIRVNA